METNYPLAYVEHIAKIHAIYRNLVMDTPEDQALHDRLIAQADESLALALRALRNPDATR